jgi:HEAT repeat protein
LIVRNSIWESEKSGYGDIEPQILKAVPKECKTMGHGDKKASGMVCVVSRQAGTVAGTSVAISKKIAGCSVKTVTAAKDGLLKPARYKKSRTTSEASAPESRDKREKGRKKAPHGVIAALESELAAAQRKLKKAQSRAEKTQSKLASQLSELKAEKESLLSDLEQTRSEANEVAAREGELKTRVAALESDLSDVRPEEETALSDRAKEKVEMPSPAAVTNEEVQAAVFPNTTDKIIFTSALSDIASRDATVRVGAAKTMAGVRHELSVKALVAQMASESSAQVRQECIKALAALEMKEALPAVERALTDEARSVRLAAVWGLYHLAGTESVPALIRMFYDEDEEVRRRAITCIGWLGQEELAVELLPLLDDNSVSVGRAAVEAMGNLRSRQTVSALIERLNDTDVSIRKAVLGVLKTITGKAMSGPFPRNEKSLQRLIARWQEWWKEELLG